MTLKNKIAYYFDFLRIWEPSRLRREMMKTTKDRDLNRRIKHQRIMRRSKDKNHNAKITKKMVRFTEHGKLGQTVKLMSEIR